MSDNPLDQIVKGAPPPSIKLPPTPPLQNISPASTSTTTPPGDRNTPTQQLSDPLSSLPSSPPQIYLNLLILEASLRAQYLQLLSRRRLHTFFVLLLSLWTGTFTYLLFLRPREDGLGLGGSVYWVVETMEKVALMAGAVTIILFWGTGQWERGIRWPRRWVGTTNRGLRAFNLRVVVMRGPWWKEWPRHLAFLFPFMNLQTSGSEWHLVEYSAHIHGGRHLHPHNNATSSTNIDEESGRTPTPPTSTTTLTTLIEEDLAPGGDYIKLLLLPKSFSPEFRQNWEDYRADYWERENERRTLLRLRSTAQRRARARAGGGWIWWTGLWRTNQYLHQPPHRRGDLLERQHGHHGPHHRGVGAAVPDPKPVASRRRSLLRTDSKEHSRTSSRSSTAALEGEEKGAGAVVVPASERATRGTSAASSTRRKTKERAGLSMARGGIAPLTRSEEGKLPASSSSDALYTLGRSNVA